MYNKYLKPDCGNLEPDAYDCNGEKVVNSWEQFKQDEMESSDWLDDLGLDEDDLAYAKYQWEQSEKEDRKRGL